MSQLLHHEPEGDRHPYEPTAWSRYPLEPTAGERFRVGVRVDADVEDVVVEWRSGPEHGRRALEQKDATWTGEIGPFDETCNYRFVAAGTDRSDASSAWFEVAIPRWQRVRFEGLESGVDRVRVRGEHGQLDIEPGTNDSLRWAIGPNLDGSHASATTAEIDVWSVRVDASGSILLECAEVRLKMDVDAALEGDHATMWRLSWGLDPDEHLFGTGERFDCLDQRGKTPDMRVFEQYKGQGSRTYFPVPWLMSSRGYGLAIDGAKRIQFDLGASVVDEASATLPGETASGCWYSGVPRELLEAYAVDHGLPTCLPLWAFGPWMSGNEWDRDERVREVVAQTINEGIPATVLVIEAWSDEATFYLFNDTHYQPVTGSDPVPLTSMQHGGRWPDPKALIEWLHERGVRVLLWQIPVLKDMPEHDQHARDVEFATKAGYCVITTAGHAYRNRGWWFPGAKIIDFSNPEAREWWFRKRAYLLDDFGIDGFKTDGGEHLWGRDVIAFDGSTGDEAANRYPTRYLAGYHEFLRAHGHERPLTFSRAGFTGSQALPAHWAGDEDSTWAAYRASLTAGLTAATSGVAFWGWDLAGFSGELPTAELFKRATAMAAFCPIMQYHSEHNEHRRPLADRTPWNVAKQSGDTEVSTVYRFYARLRMNLVPYLYGLGMVAARTGLPMLRPMAIEYPNDPEACGIDDQFLLGTDLLVAPVLEEALAERRVYLPAGPWFDLWSGARMESGWQTVPAPTDVIPAFVRGGGCVPLWMPATAGLGAEVGLPADGEGRLVLMLFPGSSTNTLVDPMTSIGWSIDVVQVNEQLALQATQAPNGVSVWLRGAARPDFEFSLSSGDSTVTLRLDSDA